MGLFSGHGRLSRSSEFHLPIRLHSELNLDLVRARLGAAWRQLGRLVLAATNDARVVGALLVLAALALAVEMARSIL